MSKSNPFAAPKKADKAPPSPDEAPPTVSGEDVAPEVESTPKRATKRAARKKA